MEEEQIAQWADLFPGMNSMSTKDPRVFCTRWTKRKTDGHKEKKYFCCVVGRDCYGVDVIKPWATDSKEAEEEAYFKVKLAADYYEANGSWPSMV